MCHTERERAIACVIMYTYFSCDSTATLTNVCVSVRGCVSVCFSVCARVCVFGFVYVCVCVSASVRQRERERGRSNLCVEKPFDTVSFSFLNYQT